MSIDTTGIVKRVLPSYVSVSEDANSLLSSLSLDMVQMVYFQAQNRSILENRSKVNGEDIVWALKSFGMGHYADTIAEYLEKYRESIGS